MKKIKTILIVLGVVLALSGGFMALNTAMGKQLYRQVTGKWPFWDLKTVPLHGKAFTATYCEEGSDPTMLVIRQDGLFGFGDAAGNILLKPQFQDARPFCEGLAAVKKGGKWGYIDRDGNIVSAFQFADASDFHNGKAFVVMEYFVQGRSRLPLCSVLNRENDIVRDSTNVSILISYQSGVYLVFPGEDPYMHGYSFMPAYVDSDGKEIRITIQNDEYEQIYGYSEGLYCCRWWKDYKCFFVSSEDSTILAGDFGDTTGFSEGLAAVYSEEKKLWGYIDHTGAYVIEPQFSYAEPFSDGLAWISKDSQFHVIDKAGKVVCDAPPDYMNRGLFSEGLCAMQSSDGPQDSNGYLMHWGFMDTTGKMVIPCQYQETSGFHNGIAQVWIDGKMGYIDKTGKYIWEPG